MCLPLLCCFTGYSIQRMKFCRHFSVHALRTKFQDQKTLIFCHSERASFPANSGPIEISDPFQPLPQLNRSHPAPVMGVPRVKPHICHFCTRKGRGGLRNARRRNSTPDPPGDAGSYTQGHNINRHVSSWVTVAKVDPGVGNPGKGPKQTAFVCKLETNCHMGVSG